MDIHVKVIPHSEQRYETIGDWWFSATGDLEIRVSDLGDYKLESLIALHEQHEAILCYARGISEPIVTAFDTEYEWLRGRGLKPIDAEPGDDPKAPYKKEHFFATTLEMLMARELEVDWHTYEEKLANVSFEA